MMPSTGAVQFTMVGAHFETLSLLLDALVAVEAFWFSDICLVALSSRRGGCDVP